MLHTSALGISATRISHQFLGKTMQYIAQRSMLTQHITHAHARDDALIADEPFVEGADSTHARAARLSHMQPFWPKRLHEHRPVSLHAAV